MVVETIPRWSTLSLSRQFILLSSVLLLLAVALLGQWVSTRIQDAVEEDVGHRAAIFLEHFLEPYIGELAVTGDLSPQSRAAISADLARISKGLNVLQTRLWTPGGRILLASDPGLEGRTLPVAGSLAEAVAGRIAVESEDHLHSETLAGRRVFEVYVPIRSAPGGPVVAVAEFYQDGAALLSILGWTRTQTWAIVALVSLGLLAGVYGLVDRGSATIQRQRAEIEARVAELTRLLHHNEFLRRRIQQASSRSAEDSETQMRRIGADLHDGIGQLLTIASLRLEQLFPQGGVHNGNYLLVKSMLDDAMTEVRAMVAGLALPQMQGLPLAAAVSTIVMKHRHRTSTEVRLTLPDDLDEPSNPVKLAICRFVQEGLSNAFKHAHGAPCAVGVRSDAAGLLVQVADDGPGLSRPSSSPDAKRQPLGLAGLRNRVESLGGEFRILSTPGRGTTIIGHFPREA
ncbi:sensor histidine kinase [Rubellimicrobium aerolatum]|uniref:Oxygen sensor histidine kinase NreB n=1 Tax=Rubellimicrobium aerolatum TaxID=490979 RepID=A0ABW0SHA4_9RHOB|nr:sensor histidine kinase [Rubellimicrobium aerolatum]MBP1807420.1 signal transduction histidine kinase [Rubellimicrobium aerolatum]